MVYKYTKIQIIIFFFILICFFNTDQIFAVSGLMKVKEVEFKGLRFLSKNELVEKIDIRYDGNLFIIDLKSLERGFKNFPLIKKFSITETGQRLVITIIENDPQFLLAFRDENYFIPFEMDAQFRIISVKRVHLFNKPVIVISKSEIRKGKSSNRLKNFFKLMEELADINLSVYNEIVEIDLTDFHRAVILLKDRKTRFILKPVIQPREIK